MYMIDLQLNPELLVKHAEIQGHNRIHDEDLGYAAHGWLAAAMGEHAPDTFRLLTQRCGSLRMLGYTRADLKTINRHVELYASPLAADVCDWASAASKAIGEIQWRQGQMLGFEVRTCPVVRSKQGERDAFLAQLPGDDRKASRNRFDVYRDWLCSKLSGVAVLDENTFNLKAFRLVSTWRQREIAGSGEQKGRRVVRPDALLCGRLTIQDGDAFRTLLQRGIGRHRAFGFGMLLLQP